MEPKVLRRLLSKFTVGDGCWEWTAPLSGMGYAQFYDGNRKPMAHRVVYELLVGPIPEGLQLDHLCRVRHCVNPHHLEPVTARENLIRGQGFIAANVRKTHCKEGHELTPENTRIVRETERQCRTCQRVKGLAYYHAVRREKVLAYQRERRARRRTS